jgi:hypothetical protein
MRLAAILMMVFATAGLAGCDVSPSCGVGPPPPSELDGKPMYSNSVHVAHVACWENLDFRLDDGRVVSPFFTAGTNPFLHAPCSGTITARVPPYANEGEGTTETYYFLSFKPDQPDKGKP